MKTIAWDVDDVLNDLMRKWLEEKWSKEHGGRVASYSEISANPPHMVLGVGLDEYLASLDAYRLSPHYQQLEPFPEVLQWFSRCGDRFRHIAVTSTPLIAAPASAQWVLRHFGRWIRTFHVVPSARKNVTVPVYDGSKAGFLTWIAKVDVLVDDSQQNIAEAERLGVRGILVPRPWNSGRGTMGDMLAVLEHMI